MTLRIGLLGTGDWAAGTHAAGLAGHPDARLAGVWGRDPARAGALAGRYGVPAYREVDALLADVDAVSCALPPDVQAPLAIRAARAGRHLLLDKPVALALPDADRLVEAVRRAGVASLVFVTNRYLPEVSRFLDGLAGPGWYGARATMLASIYGAGSRYAGSAWRRAKGGLWDLGPHALSLVLPVLGPVVEVRAMAAPHSTVHALLRHRAGPVSTLSLSIDAPPGAVRSEIRFTGADGDAVLPAVEIDAIGAYRAAVARLAGNVAAGGRPDPLDVRDGRDAVAVLAAIEAAAGSGDAVRVG